MTSREQQDEELEVLQSIYEGDEHFKQLDRTTFQYKYGEELSYKSMVVEITWGDDYPEVPPAVNLDTFYNKHIVEAVKAKIKNGLQQQMEDMVGLAMTYTLFEWVKENYQELTADQPEAPPITSTRSDADLIHVESKEDLSKKKEKKEQLTKHQKRRIYEKMGNATGEKPRGWDWVDVVKHLSQTGSSNS